MDAILRFFLSRSIKNKDRIFFVHHLALVLRAGIALPQALLILANQMKNKRFKKVLKSVEKGVQKGNSFEQALAKYKWVFSKSFISMVRIGEMKGEIQTVLDGYYELLKKQDKIRSKVKSAMVYPVVVILALVLVSVFAITFIFPRLIELVAEFDGELPIVTRIAIWLSDFVKAFGFEMLILSVVAFLAYLVFIETPPGKWVFHYIYIRIPIFGPIVRNYNLAIIARNLGSLLQAGIPLTDALETTASTINNVYFSSSLMKARKSVGMGEPMITVLENYPYLYPDIVTQIIFVGEQSGAVGEMMVEIAEFYEEQLLVTLDSLASIIEPIIIVLLGGAVVFLALSVLMPLYALTSSI
jgi:type IV pilus assembly protein PilC